MVQVARDGACGYARVEIGKYIKTEVNSIIEATYIEASYEGSGDGVDFEYTEKTVKSGFSNSVDLQLSGIGCVKIWKDPSDGSTYALARFDSSSMSGILRDILDAQKIANHLSAEQLMTKTFHQYKLLSLRIHIQNMTQTTITKAQQQFNIRTNLFLIIYCQQHIQILLLRCI